MDARVVDWNHDRGVHLWLTRQAADEQDRFLRESERSACIPWG